MKIYQVIHSYEVDGGFGDAVPTERVVMTFENQSDAEEFVEKFSRRHIYAKPYSSLECGLLYISEIDVVSHEECDINGIDTGYFWWLINDNYGDVDDEYGDIDDEEDE